MAKGLNIDLQTTTPFYLKKYIDEQKKDQTFINTSLIFAIKNKKFELIEVLLQYVVSPSPELIDEVLIDCIKECENSKIFIDLLDILEKKNFSEYTQYLIIAVSELNERKNVHRKKLLEGIISTLFAEGTRLSTEKLQKLNRPPNNQFNNEGYNFYLGLKKAEELKGGSNRKKKKSTKSKNIILIKRKKSKRCKSKKKLKRKIIKRNKIIRKKKNNKKTKKSNKKPIK